MCFRNSERMNIQTGYKLHCNICMQLHLQAELVLPRFMGPFIFFQIPFVSGNWLLVQCPESCPPPASWTGCQETG